MNGCETIRANLGDWLDDALGQAERDRVEAHLRDCRDCESFFARQRSLATDLTALGKAADCMAAVPVVSKRRKSSVARVLVRIAAGVVLVTTVGLIVAHYFDGSQRAAETLVRDNLPKDCEAPATDGARFRSTHEDDRIAVPIASGNPRIHIVWLYDTPERDGPPSGEEEDGDMPV